MQDLQFSKREWIKMELKFFSIRMRILNSEYFFGFNWMQLKNCTSYSRF